MQCSACLAYRKPWVLSQAPHKSVIVVHAWKVEGQRSEVQGQPSPIHNELEVDLRIKKNLKKEWRPVVGF